MAAVAVLVVVAIAGIVLGTMRGKGAPSAPTASDSTPATESPMTAAPPPAAEASAGPNQIVFAPGSDRVSESASAKIAKIAETAKVSATSVTISSRIESRVDRAEQMELAKKRTAAVRQVLQGAGIPLGRMRIDISEHPNGMVSAAQANSVEVLPR
jgi:outer membrane protein OmpA-like peptidoglycan-associated protein